MNNEVVALANQIREKLDKFYNKGVEYKVFTAANSILIKGNANILSGTYRYYVPGEIPLSVDTAKRFLITLDRAIIINNYLDNNSYPKKNGISFKVTSGNKIVFEMDGKEIPYWDIDTLYYKLERKVEKSPLSLSLNMIKAKDLYERYTTYYEQAEKKYNFLKSYNDLIATDAGKLEAIQFAKRNCYTWLKMDGPIPSREFDITGDEDLVDTIINNERVTFDYSQIPLEKRKKYLTNLENYELRIDNFIKRLEIEIKKVEEYNEKANELLSNISKKSRLSISTIEDLPEYDCVSTDDILAEEKKKYDDEIKEKYTRTSTPKTIDQKYPWLKDIDQQQRFNLDRKEATAVMLYKSFMYNLFNNIISYVRNNNLQLTEIYNDSYVESLIREEYDKHVKKMEEKPSFDGPFRKNTVSTVVDDIFPANYVPDYNRFRQIALDNLALLEPALSKVTLKEPLTVYRCVYEPIESQIYDADLGNAFLSTTTSVDSVTDIMRYRENDIKYKAKKVIYKIELPAGSPVIAFTDDLFLKYGSTEAGFREEQQEILIDSKNYDFEYVTADFNRLIDGTYLDSVTIKAIPKLEKDKDIEKGFEY